MLPGFMNHPDIGFSKDNCCKFSPSYQQTSVIQRTPETSSCKSINHTFLNMNESSLLYAMNKDNKHTDCNEIKLEDTADPTKYPFKYYSV